MAALSNRYIKYTHTKEYINGYEVKFTTAPYSLAYEPYRDYERLGFTSMDHGIVTRNSVYTVSTFKKHLDQNTKRFDIYHSINPLKADINGVIKRDIEHLGSLKVCAIDIDCYKYGYTPDELLDILEQDYFGLKIPTPTYVKISRGLWLFWVIDEHPKALPKWKIVQEFLYQALKEFGADRECVTNPVCLTRVPGSVNSKNGQRVFIVDCHGGKYTLHNIISAYITGEPYLEQDFWASKKDTHAKKYKKKNDNRKKSKDSSSSAPVRISTYTQNMMRKSDVEWSLLNKHDFEHSGREIHFFLMRTFMKRAGMSHETIDNELLRINRALNHPLPEKEVLKVTMSGEKHSERYNYKNETIIELLELTEDDMPYMRTIVSNHEASKREKERKKAYYRDKLEAEGRMIKKDSVEKALYIMRDLLSEGKTREEIMDALNISKSTYYNYLKMIDTLPAEEEVKATEVNMETKVNGNAENTGNVLSYPTTSTESKKFSAVLIGLCPIDSEGGSGEADLGESVGNTPLKMSGFDAGVNPSWPFDDDFDIPLDVPIADLLPFTG